MNKYIFLSIILIGLFMTGCEDIAGANLLDGSNIDQKQVKVTQGVPARHVEVFGIGINSFQYGDFDIDKFQLLTTPKDFDCGEAFYASYDNQLLYLELGEMPEDHWFISNKNDSTLKLNNFRHFAGCYFRNDDFIIYAGNNVPTDLNNFKVLNTHYSRNDKDNHYIYDHIDPNY